MSEPNIVTIAALIADNTRASMLIALMSGKALTATELATVADVMPQTASSHLSKLVDGGLLVVRKQGRHKYFQLKDEQIAALIEQILNISAATTNKGIDTGPANTRLRVSRICYDHLAGELGVALYSAFIRRGFLIDGLNEPQLSEKGATFFSEIGVDIEAMSRAKRPLCKACLDWSERRSHLAGSLGKWILQDTFNNNWAKQDLDSRAIAFSVAGLRSFKQRYGITL